MKRGGRSLQSGHENLFEVLIQLHALQAASKEPVMATEIAEVLTRRGYKVSSRSALALLRSFERRGWVEPQDPSLPLFRATPAGRKALREFKPRVAVLWKQIYSSDIEIDLKPTISHRR